VVVSQLSPYPYYLLYTVPIATLFMVLQGGALPLIYVVLLYLSIAACELVAGKDGYNPSKAECKYLESRLSFRFITWLWVPVQIGLVALCCIVCSSRWASMSWIEFVGISLLIGSNTGGAGITVAHELIHKNSKIEQFLGKILLFCVSYTHFYIEHLWGHHKRVATYEDPATSRFGESLYEFMPRSVYGSYMSAWHLENRRLSKAGIPCHSPSNQMIQYHVAYFAFIAVLLLLGGYPAVVAFVAQSVVGFSLLEIVNYIEHYGLQRKELGARGSGVYERVTPLHSWNADHRITNYFIFKLQRHSDHHTWPARRYQTLRSWDFSPQLPTGYIGMTLLALVPPLYHLVMDPQVEAYNAIMYGGNPLDDSDDALVSSGPSNKQD